MFAVPRSMARSRARVSYLLRPERDDCSGDSARISRLNSSMPVGEPPEGPLHGPSGAGVSWQDLQSD